MSQEPSVAQKMIGDFAPKLVELTDNVLFGDVWERPGLAKRDRSLVTVSALIALNRTEQLRGHIERALDNGVTKDELVEVITHLAFYSGWPTAISAAMIAKEIVVEKGRKGGWKLDEFPDEPHGLAMSLHNDRGSRRIVDRGGD